MGFQIYGLSKQKLRERCIIGSKAEWESDFAGLSGVIFIFWEIQISNNDCLQSRFNNSVGTLQMNGGIFMEEYDYCCFLFIYQLFCYLIENKLNQQMSSPVSNQNQSSPNESINQHCSHPSNQPKVILLAVAFALIVAMLSTSQLLPQNLCAGIMLALPFTSFQVKAFNPSASLIFAVPVHLLVSWANIKVAQGYPQFCRQGGHWCLSCLNITYCQSCRNGYYVNSQGKCTQCENNPGCNVCDPSNPSVCLQCKLAYQYDSAGYCNSSVQLYFNGDFECVAVDASTVCFECQTQLLLSGYAYQRDADSSGNCLKCSETDCIKCANNKDYCQECDQNTALVNGFCPYCDSQIPNCYLCFSSSTICYQCYDGYGANLTDNQCYPCLDPNCWDCSGNLQFCQKCNPLYGINLTDRSCYLCDIGYGTGDYLCQPCTRPNCVKCYYNSTICTECSPYYGVDNSSCTTCQDVLCANCSLDYTSCTQCRVACIAFSGSCVTCQSQIDYCWNCQLNSNNVVSCLQCFDNKYYLALSVNGSVVCQICHYQIGYCFTCQVNTNSEVSCLQCVNNSFYLAQNASNPQVYICADVCGDLQAYILECDNEVGVPFDGCTDTCQVQDQFVCQVDSSTRLSKCLFYGAPLLEIKSISKRDKFENKINVVVKITPKLHAFQQIPLQQFIKTFQMSPNTTIDSMLYDHQSGIITFNCSIDGSLVQGQDFFIEFLPNLTSLEQFSLMNSSTANTTLSQTYYFHSQSQITTYKIISFVFYAICGLGVVSCILSLILRSLPGLEAMLVLQFSWISLFWSTSQYYDLYRLVEPFKYSTGYNHAFLPENETSSLGVSPHYSQLGVSIDHIANNFSFVFILQLLALVSVLVTVVRLRAFNKNNPNVNALSNNKELYDQQQSFVSHNETAYQCLMFSVVLGLVPFANNVIIFFKFSDDRAIPDYAFLAVQVLLIVFVIVKNLLDPSVFGYFRFSFRTQELAMKHYLIKITVLVLVCTLQEYSYASLAPLAIMVAYTLIYRPYKYVKQNIRSAFNYLVMCSFLCFCVFVDHYVQTKQPQVQFELLQFVKVYFLINFVALLVIVIVGSIIFSIIYYCQEKRLQQQKLLAKNQAERQKQKLGQKILKQMVRTEDVNQTFRKILQQSTFKEVMNPDVSLLDAALQLKQNHQQQRQKNKERQMEIKYMEKERAQQQIDGKLKSKTKIKNVEKLQLQQTQMETQLRNYQSNKKRQMEISNRANANQLSKLEEGNGNKIRQCRKMMEKQKFKRQPKPIKQVFVKHNTTCDNGKTNNTNASSEIAKNNLTFGPGENTKTPINISPNVPISQSLEVKTQIVERTLISEHNFLRLRGAETIIKKEMSQPKEVDEDLYLKMYEDIDATINNSANGEITKKQ